MTGYTGRTPQDLLTLAEERNALLIDIRLSAASRVPVWRLSEMQEFFKRRYVHLPALGNLNYKSGDPDRIVIKDFALGLSRLRNLLKSHNLILLCVCRSAESCHRMVIKQKLAQYDLIAEEIVRDDAKKKDDCDDLQMSLFG